jgi:signal peptidase II
MSNSQNSLLLVREKKGWRQLWWIFAIIGGSVFLDQLTKYLAVVFLQGEPSFPIIEDVIHFTFVKNPGAAFGMLKDHRWVFMVVSTVAIVGILIYLFRFTPKSKIMQISLSMIVGGGIGNMIDRVYLGYVIDFIDVRLIDFAVFNVADSFVTVGAFLLMGYMIYDTVKEYQREKAAKNQQAEAAENQAEQNDAENGN